MKKGLLITVSTLSVLAILLPFLFLMGVAAILPSQHSNWYNAALDDKVARLDSIEGPKLVVVGGSSVAFGLDSELLETYMGMPVVNFGLYADLGTKIMLDLSEDAIGEGDIVVLAPELDPQTLSMFFNGLSTWRAIDDEISLITRLKMENMSSMWGSLWGFAKSKLKYYLSGSPEDPSGVYNSKNLNAWGDIRYVDSGGNSLRVSNVMGGNYYQEHTPIDPSISVWDETFLDYVNAYIARLEKKGATVYYAYCPMNRLAVTDENGDCIILGELPSEKIAAYEADLAEALDCEILGSFADYTYPLDHFYDSNFHLNSAGVARHTRNLLRDLSSKVKGSVPTVDDTRFEIPELVPHPVRTDVDPRDTYVDGDFLFRLTLSGEVMISGVSEAGLSKTLLAVPSTVTDDEGNVYTVTMLGAEAFSKCTVTRTVAIGPEFLSSIGNRVFAGSSVRECYLYSPVKGGEFGEISCSQSAFLEDAPSGFTVYIASEHYSDYATDYFWESLLTNLSDVFKKTTVTYEELVLGLDISDFTYVENRDGTLTLVGVTDRAKDDDTLRIPAAHKGKRISAIAENAFVGAVAQTVVFHPDTEELTVKTGALVGSEINLLVIYSSLGSITVESGISSGDVFYGVGGGFYEAYTSSPAWAGAFIMDYTDTTYDSLFE